MKKIVCLMGKSSTGKDTIFKELLSEGTIKFSTIVPYTTRPIREGEKDGVEYFFTDEEGFQKLKAEGKIIEDREYDTCHGLWRYFTVNDGQFNDDNKNYIMIGTIESFCKLKDYFGEDKILPVMIELDDGVRLQRALDRERKPENQKYEEMCRRFLADSVDFAEEKIRKAGIMRSFCNDDLHRCLAEILEYIEESR
uniref:guanylate kinase n=1 Tax=Acetatifactor sp. TaxID=1872090 RepID=UPI004056029C